MKSIICAAGVIRRGDRIIIAQRSADSKLEPLKWEFPGGKIEFAEDPKACLAREIREEMGFDIEVGEIFDVVSHNYRRGSEIYHVLLLCYLCEYLNGEPRPIECHDIRWVGLDEINGYDFAEADIPILRKLCSAEAGGPPEDFCAG